MIFDDRSNMTRPDHPHSKNENEFQWPNIYSKMSGSDDTPIQDVTNVEAKSNLPLSFKRILQHFAVATGQKHSHLTMLLKLLKEHKPEPYYDTLPSTGGKLLQIDGSDFSGKSKENIF